ncbi:MAG: hypothetical protein ABL903_18090 [Methylococcales bacterium]
MFIRYSLLKGTVISAQRGSSFPGDDSQFRSNEGLKPSRNNLNVKLFLEGFGQQWSPAP